MRNKLFKITLIFLSIIFVFINFSLIIKANNGKESFGAVGGIRDWFLQRDKNLIHTGSSTNAYLITNNNYNTTTNDMFFEVIGGAKIDNLFASSTLFTNATTTGSFYIGKDLTVMDGNVGIGTTNPLGNLHVYSAAGESRIVADAAAGQYAVFNLYSAGVDKGAVAYRSTDARMGLWTSGAERVVIQDGGNVGIGTTTPEYKLSVAGQIYATSTSNQLMLVNDLANSKKATFSVDTNGDLAVSLATANATTTFSNAVKIQRTSGGNENLFRVGTSTSENLLVVKSSGYVGIGTTSPNAKLNIYGVGDSTLLRIDATQYNFSTLMNGESLTIKNGYTGGAWDRALMSFVNANDAVYYRMGAKGSGQTFEYGYIGSSYTAPSLSFVNDQQDLTYGSGNNLKGLVTIGTASSTTGSLFVNTASLNTSYSSGLGIDGTYSNMQSVINIKAIGVNSGGGYNSNLAFYTSNGTTVSEAMRIDKNGNVGIGTTTPQSKLHISSGAAATTTIQYGEIGNITSKVCHNTKNNNGQDISFYFVGTTMVVENNRCR